MNVSRKFIGMVVLPALLIALPISQTMASQVTLESIVDGAIEAHDNALMTQLFNELKAKTDASCPEMEGAIPAAGDPCVDYIIYRNRLDDALRLAAKGVVK